MAVLPVMADLPDRLGLEEKRNAVALGLGLLLGSLPGHGSYSTAHACIRARGARSLSTRLAELTRSQRS